MFDLTIKYIYIYHQIWQIAAVQSQFLIGMKNTLIYPFKVTSVISVRFCRINLQVNSIFENSKRLSHSYII